MPRHLLWDPLVTTWLLLLAADLPLKERLIYLVAEWSHLGVFLFLIACGLGFPCPEEVALIGGGYAVYLANGGPWSCFLMVCVAMLGVLCGDVMLWFIGRRVGDYPQRVPFIGRHLTPARMRRARALFRKHGAKAVFFGRFLFGIRAVTFFVSGSLRVPLTTFVVMDGLAALISVPISVVLAWYFGAQLEEAGRWIGRLDTAILLVVGLVGLVVGFTMWQQWRRSQARKDAAAEAEPPSTLGVEDGEDEDAGDPALAEGESVPVSEEAQPG